MLFGAILLSAVGSLPLHLTPLILVALIADGRVSVGEAGWVASVIIIGQLLASLILPILRISIVSRSFVTVVVVLLLLGLSTTAFNSSICLYTGWCLVGMSCGVLMYIGTVSASHYRRTTLAFSLRLGLVLVLAGSATFGLLASNALVSYQAFLTIFLLICSLLCITGVMLYSPIELDIKTTVQGQEHQWTYSQITGLLTIYILFVGLAGFLAYVAHGAIDRGMAFVDAAMAIAAVKIIAGIWLFVANRKLETKLRQRFLEIGIVLSIGLALVSGSREPIFFFLSLLIVEIAFNTLSASFQAAFAEANRSFAGQWLTGTFLLGAACGPPLQGAAVGADLTLVFTILAMGTAFIPAIWVRANKN